jgi:hypothetical protein
VAAAKFCVEAFRKCLDCILALQRKELIEDKYLSGCDVRNFLSENGGSRFL